MNHRCTILILSVLLHCSALYPQHAGDIFYNLTTANGLSSNAATSVIQDKQGFYWIGTLDGLNRFDGNSCKIFQHDENDSNSLSHNHCLSIMQDIEGNIWIATLMGVNRYRIKENEFDHFVLKNPKVNFETANFISGMTQDSAGNIWITSY